MTKVAWLSALLWSRVPPRLVTATILHKGLSRALIATLACSFVASCAIGSEAPAPEPSMHLLEASSADYAGAVWIKDDVIAALQWYEAGRDAPNAPAIVLVRADGSPIRRIHPSSWMRCTSDLLVNSPHLLPDGRLGYVQWCNMTTDTAAGPELWGLDVSSGVAARLTSLRQLNMQRGDVTWDPAMSGGFLGIGSRLCDGIVAFDRSGTVAFPSIQVSDGRNAFPISADAQSQAEDCTSGQARVPAISRDGQNLAFLASTGAVGVHGLARLDEPFDLYIRATQTSRMTRIRLGLVDATALEWSPDGHTLAVVANSPGADRSLWLVDVSKATYRLLATGVTGGISWSPDGHHIVALKPTDASPDSAFTLVSIDVPS